MSASAGRVSNGLLKEMNIEPTAGCLFSFGVMPISKYTAFNDEPTNGVNAGAVKTKNPDGGANDGCLSIHFFNCYIPRKL